MFLKATIAVLFVSVSLSLAYGPCRQRFAQDFRADETDCSRFHMCSLGQLVTFTCSAGSVFDEQTHTCVPAYSVYDKCTSRMASKQRCPPGSQGPVPHPTKCAQYYDCGATHANNRMGWDSQLRECPYPFVFSPNDKKCMLSTPGLCANREEPLDQCDYKEHQCEGHSECVPCHVRFPTCRGHQDGLNAWSGRQGSPYYVTCHQQRVVASAMCEQKEAVVIFDEERRECVKKEEGEKPEVPQIPTAVRQTIPQLPQNQGYITQQRPSYQQTGFLGYQNNHAQGTYQQGYRPQYQTQVPARNQYQKNLNLNQYQNTNNQYHNTNSQYQHTNNQNVYNPHQKQQPTHIQYSTFGFKSVN
ncbi:hypothetical protein V1264_020330 [Littorina saxatilis]